MNAVNHETERRGFLKAGLLATAGSIAVGTANADAATQESAIVEQMLIEHDCAKLVNRFHHLFNKDMSLVANSELFTSDATMDLGGYTVGPGPDAMPEPLREASERLRNGTHVVLNTVSNIVISVTDENHATGISHDTQWKHIYEGDKDGRPAPVPLPTYLGYWNDEFKREGEEWKFATRTLRFTFDQRRWSEPTASNYPESIIVPHEQWRRSIDGLVK